jgi:nickel-dependent lactate racemase
LVEVWLPYGKTEICVRIPTRNYLGSVEPKENPGVENPRVEIERALHEPVGSPPLSELAKPNQKIAIVVDDHTRATPSHLIVPPILDELNKVGVKDENVNVIFGCGAHRAVKLDEMSMLLGKEIIERVKVTSHDCKAKDLVYLGKTQTYGTKIYVNKVFAEADLHILTGDVGLHYYAGFGGGRKSVLPAISGEESIQHNHAMLLHPKARTGVLEGNPIHQDMMEAAKIARVDFIINVVINSKSQLVRAFAGDLEQAFQEGVKLVDEMYKVPVERRADIVVVSSGGYPHDLDLYQAYKGVDNALNAVKRGGAIVWIAECPEGYGNQVFYDWMRKFKELKEIETEIKRHFDLGGHKTCYLLRALQKANIILVSILPDYYARSIFRLRTARAINDALRDAFETTGRDAKVLVIPQGNITLPFWKGAE